MSCLNQFQCTDIYNTRKETGEIESQLLCSASLSNKSPRRRGGERQFTDCIHPVCVMPKPESGLHMELGSDGVDDLVAPHLVHQIHGHLRRQRHPAGHHVHVQDLVLAPPLHEWRQRLRRDGPAPEQELDDGGSKHRVDLLVGVGDVGHERHVAVEVCRRVDVDAVQAGVGGVERRRPGLHRQEDDQDGYAGDDQGDAEGVADDGGAPHGRRGPVAWLQDYLRRRRRRYGWR
jgi:hypothetical protein